MDHYQKYDPPSQTVIEPLDQFSLVDNNTVLKLVGKMQTKSCELDPIPTHFVKENISEFVAIFKRIINTSFDENYFSTKWKTAILQPLLKKTDLDLIDSNYRPVSNLSFVSKLVENTVIGQLVAYIDYNGTTSTHQSAYKSHHSCETALTKLTKDILWAMENKSVLILVCLDLSAAFDTVDHDVLIQTLHNQFGVSGKALDWFCSYLHDRYMKVLVNHIQVGNY